MAVGVDSLCLRRVTRKARWPDKPIQAKNRLRRSCGSELLSPAVSGPSVCGSLTGGARDALAAAGLGLGPAQSPCRDPDARWLGGSAVCSRPGWRRRGEHPAWLGGARAAGPTPCDFHLRLLLRGLLGLGGSCRGWPCTVRAWPSECGQQVPASWRRVSSLGVGPAVGDEGRGVSASRFHSFVLCCCARRSQFSSIEALDVSAFV